VKRLLQHLALAVVPLALVLGVSELALRLTGAAQNCPNRFSDTKVWVCDPILQFRLDPSLKIRGEPLNSRGFRDREFERKRDGVLRMLALGDSCTFGQIGGKHLGYVDQPYPLRLQRVIERRLGPGRVEVLNAGIPGYNSRHGVLLLQTKLRDLQPDIVTVRYGWNDHFLSAAGEGVNFYEEPRTTSGRWLEGLLLRTQIYPFVRRLGLELVALRTPVKDQQASAWLERATWVPTIPRDDYERNLGRIVDIARSRGAEVWLLTSPRNPAPSQMAVDKVSVLNKIPFDDLMKIHDQYNDVVRRVAQERGVLLVDMDEIYRRHADEPLFSPDDAVHPNQGGHNLEAQALLTALELQHRLPAPAR
jgi:lysophospholipase L1-like esterase